MGHRARRRRDHLPGPFQGASPFKSRTTALRVVSASHPVDLPSPITGQDFKISFKFFANGSRLPNPDYPDI